MKIKILYRMPKLTLDMATFKALASDTRLDILRALDGKKMSLKDIAKATKLNKATLHEHLIKLNEAGLVKRKEREGHKWVYYKLTWKGEGLLHPENTKIVVMFSATFIALAVGIINFVNYIRGEVIGRAVNYIGSDSTVLYEVKNYGKRVIVGSAKIGTELKDDAIAEVPIKGQTTEKLTQAFVANTHNVDFFGQELADHSIEWDSVVSEGITLCSADGYNSVPARLSVEYNWFYGDTPPAISIPNGIDADLGGEVAEEIVNGGTGSLGTVSNVPQEMIATFHDPALQQLAIICIVIFSILICVSIWWFWKNRKSTI